MALVCTHSSLIPASRLSSPSTTLSSSTRATLRAKSIPARQRVLATSAAHAPSSSATLTPEDASPTPILPGGSDMADFLMTFSRALNNSPGNGKSIAAAGRALLSRLRSGIDDLAKETDMQSDFQRQLRVSETNRLLLQVESDLVLIAVDSALPSKTVAVQLLRMHCAQAARILRTL